MNVHILTVGDELLIGQVIDTNSAWMGEQLNANGAKVVEISSISDTRKAILESVERALQDVDVVLMTGGLGPTKDDITKKTLADFFGVGMSFHEETHQRILRLFERLGRTTTKEHEEQCFMPDNATILKNKMGTAPGMWFEQNGKVLVSMPGVPYEMKYLMESEVLPRLRESFQALPIAHRTVLTIGDGESRIAARIEAFTNTLPEQIKMAFLPSLGSVRLRLTGTGEDAIVLNRLLDEKQTELVNYIPELVYGYEKDTIQAAVGRLLKDQQKTIGFTESCTGGYLTQMLTSVAGASQYFKGSIIAYSNEIKMRQLNVQAGTLEQDGAVSEACVREMVAGGLKAIKSDIVVAISGIAGPGGGTEEKPVGTIWLAIGNAEKTEAVKLQLGKKRLQNVQYASTYALNMIRKFLI